MAQPPPIDDGCGLSNQHLKWHVQMLVSNVPLLHHVFFGWTYFELPYIFEMRRSTINHCPSFPPPSSLTWSSNTLGLVQREFGHSKKDFLSNCEFEDLEHGPLARSGIIMLSSVLLVGLSHIWRSVVGLHSSARWNIQVPNEQHLMRNLNNTRLVLNKTSSSWTRHHGQSVDSQRLSLPSSFETLSRARIP